MRMILTMIVTIWMPAAAYAQSAELAAAQAAVEQILNDSARQQAYCSALKLSEQITEETARLEALGDKGVSPGETEQSVALTQSYGEKARLLQEVDVDFSDISRATSFAALRDPQTGEPYPGAETFLQDHQEMNARCHR